jgi:hypothetical protein
MMWIKIILKGRTSKFWGLLFCELITIGIDKIDCLFWKNEIEWGWTYIIIGKLWIILSWKGRAKRGGVFWEVKIGNGCDTCHEKLRGISRKSPLDVWLVLED